MGNDITLDDIKIAMDRIENIMPDQLIVPTWNNLIKELNKDIDKTQSDKELKKIKTFKRKARQEVRRWGKMLRDNGLSQ